MLIVTVLADAIDLSVLSLVLLTRHDVLLDSLHEFLVFRHLLKGLANVLQEQQVGVLSVELQELAKVGVLFILGPDASLL